MLRNGLNPIPTIRTNNFSFTIQVKTFIYKCTQPCPDWDSCRNMSSRSEEIISLASSKPWTEARLKNEAPRSGGFREEADMDIVMTAITIPGECQRTRLLLW